MSDVKRWKETESWGFTEWDCMAVMEECDNGDYVLYSDYARLKAEVERLRKAGDAMAFNYEQMHNINGVYDSDLMKFVARWNAAKDGKPSV